MHRVRLLLCAWLLLPLGCFQPVDAEAGAGSTGTSGPAESSSGSSSTSGGDTSGSGTSSGSTSGIGFAIPPTWGARGFKPVTAYPVPSERGALGLAVGDIDGDGFLDVVTASSGTDHGAIWIWFGNGDGTLADARLLDGPSDSERVVIGDVDGDGLADLLVGGPTSTAVWILHNDGNREFTQTTKLTSGAALEIAVADFNRDGQLDVAVVSWTSLAIFLGRNHTLVPGATYAGPTQASGISVVDLDGDGLPDVAIADLGSEEMWVFHGNGDGTLGPGEKTPCGTARTLAVADVTADGRLDLISANGGEGSSVTVLPEVGGLRFGSVVQTKVEGFPVAVAAGDFNGDGRADVAVGDLATNDLTIELGVGDGTFAAPRTLSTNGVYAIAVGDLNSDGKPDIVFVPAFGQSFYVVVAY